MRSEPTNAKSSHTEVREACPACQTHGKHSVEFTVPDDDWRLRQCRECDLVYLENVLSVASLDVSHSWTEAFEQTRRRQLETTGGRLRFAWRNLRLRILPHRKAEALIRRYVVEGDLLDVGCGRGSLFERLDDLIVPSGIEVDRQAAAKAEAHARKRGGRVLCCDALQGLRALEPDTYDGVLMRSFLEHEVSPLAVLHEVKRVLCPPGVLIIKVPNYACWNRRLRGWKWSGLRFPEHVNYFTPSTLRSIVSRAGFQIQRFAWRDRLPTSDNMWMIASKPNTPAIGVVRPQPL